MEIYAAQLSMLMHRGTGLCYILCALRLRVDPSFAQSSLSAFVSSSDFNEHFEEWNKSKPRPALEKRPGSEILNLVGYRAATDL